MRFLCLHGMGTNSRIFEAQTAAIRYSLGSQHTFEFLDGAVPAQMAPTIEPFVSPSDDFLQYANDTSSQSCRKALSDLETYIIEDGPFDGVMAFSQGAGLAASLLIHQMQTDAHKARLYPAFSCAVFFSGGVPQDPRAERNEGSSRLMRWEDDGEVIEIPTVHVWGRNDTFYPTFGPVLSKLCKASEREELVHNGGHDIPGSKDPVTVENVARLIKRTIERAATAS